MLVQRLLDGKNRELAVKENELQRAKAALKAAQVQIDLRLWHGSQSVAKDLEIVLNCLGLGEWRVTIKLMLRAVHANRRLAVLSADCVITLCVQVANGGPWKSISAAVVVTPEE